MKGCVLFLKRNKEKALELLKQKINGHRIDMEKKKQKRIDDQKQLEILIRERDERLKARAKRS